MEKTSSITDRRLNRRRLAAVAGVVVVTIMATVVLIPLPAAAAASDDEEPLFRCSIGNHMSEDMIFECGDVMPLTVRPDTTVERAYYGVSAKERSKGRRGRRTCMWSYAGNNMTGVVVWDEGWPEAPSCSLAAGHGGCTLLFENKAVTLVAGTGGRRVLGDLAVKECSSNWGGLGGWLPFGLGCTYPEHEHPYVGTVVS